MGRHKQKNGQFLPAGLQVRHGVMEIIYRNPHLSVMIPSAQQLSQRYGLSRTTVTAELKKMIDEGWLEGRRGVGTFTRPGKMHVFSDGTQRRIIGIICQDSWQLWDNYTCCALKFQIAEQLLPESGYPKELVITNRDPKNILHELLQSNLGGIIWILPPQEWRGMIRQLRQNGMPVVTIYDAIPGVSSVCCDHLKIGEEIARLLHLHGKERIIWFPGQDSYSLQKYRGTMRYFRRHKLDCDGVITDTAISGNLQQQRQLLQESRAQAVFCHSDYILDLLSMLEKANLADEITPVTSWSQIRHLPHFRGIYYRHDFAAMGAAAAQLLLKQLDEPAAPAEKRLIPSQVHWAD